MSWTPFVYVGALGAVAFGAAAVAADADVERRGCGLHLVSVTLVGLGGPAAERGRRAHAEVLSGVARRGAVA